MSWNKVGQWLKDNGTTGAALVGSLLTGNIPSAVAAGVGLVSSATGLGDPDKALQALQHDPATIVRLQELANENDASIRQHIADMARIELEQHQATQQTIQSGDNATDDYARRTRPLMARVSLWVTLLYGVLLEVLSVYDYGDGASWEVISLLSAPAWAYMGLRTFDGFAPYSKSSKDKLKK